MGSTVFGEIRREIPCDSFRSASVIALQYTHLSQKRARMGPRFNTSENQD
jgi:hypothetical protein